MKKCDTCKLELSEDSFNKNKAKKDGLNSICRICSNKRSKQYYQENKEKHKEAVQEHSNRYRKENRKRANDIKSKLGCSICGEKDVCCLDFHHLDKNKESDISKMVQGSVSSWERIQQEIDKCIVVCSNCHRKIHNKEKEDEIANYIK